MFDIHIIYYMSEIYMCLCIYIYIYIYVCMYMFLIFELIYFTEKQD